MALNAPTLQSSIAPFILLAPEVGIAPTSPRFQRGANLPQLLGGACARPQLVVPAGDAPASSGYQPGAGGRVQTPFELRDGFHLWFQTETWHRPKNEVRLRGRSDEDDTTWFVALAIEQLALVTDNRSHRFPFVEGCG